MHSAVSRSHFLKSSAPRRRSRARTHISGKEHLTAGLVGVMLSTTLLTFASLVATYELFF